MGAEINGQMDLFSMMPESEEKETGAVPEKKAKTSKPASALARELDRMALKSYEAKQADSVQPDIKTKEYADRLSGRKCVMHREFGDAAASTRRFYYDYNTVFECGADGGEKLLVFETAREAVDYYFSQADNE